MAGIEEADCAAHRAPAQGCGRVGLQRRLEVAVPVAVLFAAAWVLWVPPSSDRLLRVSDAIEYSVAAMRFAEGDGLTVTVGGQVHPSRYPPGFPVLLLAPVYAAAGSQAGFGILAVTACALASLALLLRAARRMVAGPAGLCAGVMAIALALSVDSFYRHGREILSELPLLFAFLVAMEAFAAAANGRGWRAFLVGGIAIAFALSMRVTSLAFALPFSILWLARAEHRRARELAAFALPIALAAAALALYQARTFGSPFYTGYHYWLHPGSYRPATGKVVANLFEMVQPFAASGARTSVWKAWIGPVALAACAALGIACRLLRPRAWSLSRSRALFLAGAALPIAAFHLFYPFPDPRFHLAAHVVLPMLGAAWFSSLLFPVSRRVLVLCAVLLFLLSLQHRRPWRYARRAPALGPSTFLERAAELLPGDAVLVTDRNAILVDRLFCRGSTRRMIPLSGRTMYGTWRVGRYGEARERMFPFTAGDSLPALEALVARGVPVFLDRDTARDAHTAERAEMVAAAFPAGEVLQLPGGARILRLAAGR